MADSAFRGPLVNMGAMEDSPATVQTNDGPSYSYQGNAIANVIGAAYNKDGVGPGRTSAFLDNPRIVTVDNIPQAVSTTAIAAATTVVTATPITLATVNGAGSAAGAPTLAVAIPIIPFGASAVTTAALALDFGFTTGTTAAGSGAIAVSDTTVFTAGQWLIVGGAGNAGKTTSLITQVQTITATGITVLPIAGGTLANAPIGAANLFNNLTPPATQFGPSANVPTAWAPDLVGGALRLRNPLEMLARCISIGATSTAGAGGAFLVSGWDVYGQPMTETITPAAATTAFVYGKKAFKFIKSVVPQFTDSTGQYSVGFGDTFGFPLRQDRWETIEEMYNNTRVVTGVGFLAPVLTNPATAATGDVRGTVQLSTNGANTAVASPVVATTDGTKRLTIIQTLPLWNDISATPLNTVPFIGVKQA